MNKRQWGEFFCWSLGKKNVWCWLRSLQIFVHVICIVNKFLLFNTFLRSTVVIRRNDHGDVLVCGKMCDIKGRSLASITLHNEKIQYNVGNSQQDCVVSGKLVQNVECAIPGRRCWQFRVIFDRSDAMNVCIIIKTWPRKNKKPINPVLIFAVTST